MGEPTKEAHPCSLKRDLWYYTFGKMLLAGKVRFTVKVSSPPKASYSIS
jgi:hypothetical protein